MLALGSTNQFFLERFTLRSLAFTCCCIRITSAIIHTQAETCSVGFDIVHLSPARLALALQWCANEKRLLCCNYVHSQILESGFEQNAKLGKLLVQAYGSCGALEDALALFRKLSERNVVVFNIFLQRYAREKKNKAVSVLFNQMHEEALLPNKLSYVGIFSECAVQKSLRKGKHVHTCILCNHGVDIDAVLSTSIINMYGKCGHIDQCEQAFNKAFTRDVVCWTAMISIYASHGYALEAFQLFEEMQQDGTRPNEATLVSVLKACISLKCLAKGQAIHHWIVDGGFEDHVVGANILIDLYSKGGSMEDAERIFEAVPKQDVATWNAIISLYAVQNRAKEATAHFFEMQEKGVMGNNLTFIHILAACATSEMLVVGEWLHALILDLDLETDILVCNALLTMYGKCDCLDGAQDFFDSMPVQDTISWNALISAYVQHKKGAESFVQVNRMKHEGYMPDKITIVYVLAICARTSMLGAGKQLHVFLLNSQIEMDTAVANALINMYSKCGDVDHACRILDDICNPDSCSYSPVIESLAEQGKVKQAAQLLDQALQEGLILGKANFVSVLSSHAMLGETLLAGKRMHVWIQHCGLETDIVVTNALLSMYYKVGSWKDALMMFETSLEHDQVTWNTMITVYAGNGLGNKAICMFYQMQLEAILPDKVTYLSCMSACRGSTSSRLCKLLHAHTLASELLKDVVVRNALISMYGKCGRVRDAYDIFLGTLNEALVSTWNAMISVYGQLGQGIAPFGLLKQMQHCGETANVVTYVSVLSGCTSQAALMQGIMLHSCLQFIMLEGDVAVENALINMYAKCGDTVVAQKVFDNMQLRDSISWTTLITMYAQLGQVQEAFLYFYRMQAKGLLPNSITLLSILGACAHSGYVGPYFDSLLHTHNSLMMPDHFVSIIDLLGRAGQLEKAEQISKMMPLKSNIVPYIALLAACRNQTDIVRGEYAAKKVLELEPLNSAARIMISSTYLASSINTRQQEMM